MKFKSTYIKQLADLITPVNAYMKFRGSYSELLLLESTDNNSASNSKSFICFDPQMSFSLKQNELTIKEGKTSKQQVIDPKEALSLLGEFKSRIHVDQSNGHQGLFGYNTFESTQYFDSHTFDYTKRSNDIPDIHFAFYRFVLVFNHYNNELELIENTPEGDEPQIKKVQALLNRQDVDTFPFRIASEVQSNLTDEAFIDAVLKGKEHCRKGDVFQIVLSRAFSVKFKGDDLCVYRSLRSINPSPYLFYFDYGSFKIFGSSPEAQLVVDDGVAEIHPIAGTYRRTGNDEEDAIHAKELLDDPKENAEHVMLVDLARNDLSRNCDEVDVKNYKEIQYFSHVIHLVSKVTGKLTEPKKLLKIFGDTFPAGTLSGAPKYKALNLIKEYENQHRTFYGGSIGYISLDSGVLNMAIIIRSFLSQKNRLHFQAGAGVVMDSVPEKELQEVNNKLGALTKALKQAEKI
jgi:anthranilate synthase component 1